MEPTQMVELKSCFVCKDLRNGCFEFGFQKLRSNCDGCLLLKKAIDAMCTSEPRKPKPAVEATIAADKPLRLELLGVFGPDLKSEFGPHSDIQIFNTKK